MTDDKGAGEGPPKHPDSCDGEFCLECAFDCGAMVGRKAERERCAKIAEGYFHARGRVVAKAIRGDRMQSDGPFSRVVETDGEAWVCVGQLIVNQFAEGEGLIVANNLCAKLNAAYEERRKAAEKDLEYLLLEKCELEDRSKLGSILDKLLEKRFQELLELADRMCDKMESEFYYVAREFYAWKKARGLE